MTAVELQGAYNVRDLGGLRTSDGRRTRHGLVYRGDSLDHLTGSDTELPGSSWASSSDTATPR